MKKRIIELQHYLTVALILAVIVSVSSCSDNSSGALIPGFDNIKDIAADENTLSSLTESCKIIRLETSDKCILGSIKKIVKKNSMYFIKTSEDELVLFDNDGNYLRKFGKIGRGPGEFVLIQDFAVNCDGSVVAICCLKNIYFYSVNDGSFIRQQKFNHYINNLFYLPNNELLARVPQADFLIAHIDSEGNILKTFGSSNRVLELEQPFEFVQLDESNIIYRVGQTTDFYQYDFKEKSVTRNQILESDNVLREQALHEELMASGPDYRSVTDYLKNYYVINYLKKLNSNFLLCYLYKEELHFVLYNPKQKIKQGSIFYPQESSNLIDDVLYLQNSSLMTMRSACSDDNAIVTYIYPDMLLKHFEEGIPEGLQQTEKYEEMLSLINSLKMEDNPVLIEYIFNEI